VSRAARRPAAGPVEQIVERVTEQIKDDEEQQNEPESFAPVDPHSSGGGTGGPSRREVGRLVEWFVG
jgi:hypothetical protein